MVSPIERLRSREPRSDNDTRVLSVDDEATDEVLDALSADTRREIYRSVTASPATTTELADRLDTTVQNVQYHLSELESSALVTPVDTVYSEKGNEMVVYGPASDPLVFVGDAAAPSAVRDSLRRLVAGLGAVALGSLFVQVGAERFRRTLLAPADDIGAASRGSSLASPDGIVWLVFEFLEPGLTFFLGLLAVAGLLAILFDD